MSAARPRPRFRPRRPIFFRPRLEILEARTVPAITVTSLADSGFGTLRAAIQSAAPGELIQFAVSGTIALSSELQISQSLTIQGANRITVQGGVGVRSFDIFSGGVTLDGLTITGAGFSSLFNGGAVLYSGTGALTVSNSYVVGNSANSAGGLENNGSGTVNLVNDTFANNQAGGGGVAGAVWNNGGTLNATNCTFTGNRSNTNEAGAIWNSSGGTTTLLNDTIYANIARLVGGGVWNQSGTVHVRNTIIAGDASEGTPDDDVAGGFDDQGHNLIGNPIGSTGFTTSTLVGGNPFPLDPMLDPLANNGGPVPTLAPHSGSPALNNGDPNGAPATDERGAPRSGPTVDIGALQFGHFIVTNTNDSGAGSLRQAILDANGHPGADLITFQSGLTGTITLTGGELSITDSLAVDGPGAGLLAVSGNNASRVFLINGGTSVALSGLTITGGNSRGSPEDPGFGGGILSLFNGTLTLNGDVLTGNTASSTGTGGGITAAFGSLAVNRTTVSNNSASQAAGLYLQDEQVVIDGSTISGNQAQDTGGLRFESDFSTSDSLTIINTTIANNTASGGLDAALRLAANNAGQTVTATLTNDTISGNALAGAGGTGGVRIFATGTVNATLTNTIVAGNTSGGSPADLLGTFAATSANNLIGTGGNLTNGQNGNLVGVNNPLLAPLGNYGGPTQTMALLPGSPAVDAGTSSGAPAQDQRGVNRVGAVDIGAFQHFIVINTNDSGPGSLRQAILDANAFPGADLITFAIPGFGGETPVISLSSDLPAITEAVTIDAYTQPGSTPNTLAVGDNANYGAALDGTFDAGAGVGLTIQASGVTVRGLEIANFASAGISVTGNNNLIAGNSVHNSGNVGVQFLDNSTGNVLGGTAPADRNVVYSNVNKGVALVGPNDTGNTLLDDYIGTADGFTNPGGQNVGVFLESQAHGNVVGGTAAGAGNVISGNALVGVQVTTGSGATASNTTILGNIIGLTADGTAALANGVGVELDFASDNNVVGGTAPGAGNVISGNTGDGVLVGGSFNLVAGNRIGTNAAGNAALGNGVGIELGHGGDNTFRGNLISGNSGDGVLIDNAAFNTTTVAGNLIGTDVTGAAALGNGGNGVTAAAPGVVVGGTTPADRNVISGNGGSGVAVQVGGAMVLGNYIGTDVTGTVALGNAGDGVRVENGAGGTQIGAGNVISGNGGNGVVIDASGGCSVFANLIGTDVTGTAALGNAGDGVRVQNGSSGTRVGGTGPGAGNTIAFNGAYGVDVDSGTGNSILGNSVFANGIQGIFLNGANNANGNQAAPLLTGGSFSSSGTSISGTLTGAPNTTFRIEFFANQGLDASGNAEGQTFLGSATVTTDNSGHASFTATGLAPLPAGERYPTATATDLTTGNTSEFAVNPPASAAAAGGDGQTATVTTGFAAPLQVVVRDAFGDPLANVPVTFTAPTSGPSGTFTGGEQGSTSTVVVFTDQFGVATAFGYTANTVAGVDGVTATVQGGPSFTFTLTNAPDAATQLVFSGPAAPTAGAPATFTVTALDQFGNVATGFAGTVSFASSDGRATLPAAYTFTTGPGGDDGVHTFTATFLTAGPQTLTVTDPDPITATTSFVVQPGAPASLSVGGFPSSTPAGVRGMVTVVALDAFGNVATGFTGVVHFASNDPTAVLPSDAALAGGTGTFPVTFLTSGVKTISVTDTAGVAGTGTQSGINITAVLLPQAVLFIPIQDQQFDTVVASFTSSLSPNAGDYAATISWGDGTSSPGVIRTDDGKTFNVYGAHTYHIKTDFLVDVKVTYLKTGAFETTAPSAAAVLSPSQGAQLAEVGFVRGQSGATSLSASNSVVDAELSQPSPNSLTATVFVARYRNNPQPAFTDGTNFYDVRVTGSGPGALLVVTFRFSEVNATDTLLRFFDQETGTYVPVQSATRFPIVVDLAAGTITVTFDATSFPKLKDLTGSVFSISVTVPPPAPQSTLSPAASLAFAGQSAPAQEVAFQPSTQLGLSLVPSQTRTLAAARADLTGAADSSEMSDDDYNFLVDLLNSVIGDGGPAPGGGSPRRPATRPAGRDATAGPEDEQEPRPEPSPEPDPGEVRAEPAPGVDPLDAFFAKSAVEGPDLTLPPAWAAAAGADGVLERSAEGRPTLLAAPLVGALLAGVPARPGARRTRRGTGRRPLGS